MLRISTTPLNRSMENHSRKMFQKRINSGHILRQEDAHAQAKRPISRFAVKTDATIRHVSNTVQEVSQRVTLIKKELRSLQVKVEKLGALQESQEKQNQCQRYRRPSLSVTTLLQKLSLKSQHSSSSSSSSSPLKRTSFPVDTLDPANNFGYLRDRKILEIQLKASWGKAKAESAVLKNVYHENLTILKYKRAERCLQSVIRTQRRVKYLQVEFSQLIDRLINTLGNA